MRSGVALMLAHRFDEKPGFNIAPLAPSAAQRAALKLLTLERACCDGRGRFN
jgi:hypothetical protein